MSIFSRIGSAIAGAAAKVKQAASAAVSRVRSALSGRGTTQPGARGEYRVPGELEPRQPSTPAPRSYDDLRAPTSQEIRGAHWRYQASHADSELSPYSRADVDTFYARTRKIWEGAAAEDRNDRIRDYFSDKYGMDDLSEIFDYVVNGEIPDTDDMIPSGEDPYRPWGTSYATDAFGNVYTNVEIWYTDDERLFM